MPESNAQIQIDILIKSSIDLLSYVKSIEPSWDILHYSKAGVGALHKEFVRIGGVQSYITTKLADIVEKKTEITLWLRGQQVQISSSVDSQVALRSKEWISLGYAQTERTTLAQVSSASALYELRKYQSLITRIDDLIGIIEMKLKDMSDFRHDAKTISNLLNFGNLLQEIV